jgi:hypothetical protein
LIEQHFYFETGFLKKRVENSRKLSLELVHEHCYRLAEDVKMPPFDLFHIPVPKHLQFELPPNQRPFLVIPTQPKFDYSVDPRSCQHLSIYMYHYIPFSRLDASSYVSK